MKAPKNRAFLQSILRIFNFAKITETDNFMIHIVIILSNNFIPTICSYLLKLYFIPFSTTVISRAKARLI